MQEYQGSPEEIRPHINSAGLIEVLDYWESLRGPGRVLASRVNFDPMAIAKLLSNVALIDVLPDDRFEYRLAGSELEERYQIDSLRGKSPTETLGADAEKVLRPYRLIRDTGCLFYRDAEEDWLLREPSFKSYKALLLPFSDDDVTVTCILGVFDFERRRASAGVP